MAPFTPDTATWRLDIGYEGITGEHSTRVRVRPDFTLQQAINSTLLVRDLLIPLIRTTAVINRLDVYAPGQSFSTPVDLNPTPGTAPGTLNPVDFPSFMTFVGRSNTGRRVRYFVYEPALLPDADYRVPVSASPNLEAMRAHLDNPASGICAIDGSDIRVYNYVNLGFNAYYQRRRRIVA